MIYPYEVSEALLRAAQRANTPAGWASARPVLALRHAYRALAPEPRRAPPAEPYQATAADLDEARQQRTETLEAIASELAAAFAPQGQKGTHADRYAAILEAARHVGRAGQGFQVAEVRRAGVALGWTLGPGAIRHALGASAEFAQRGRGGYARWFWLGAADE